MNTYTFSITGISCGSCVKKIENTFFEEHEFQSTRILRKPDRIVVNSPHKIHANDINKVFKRHQLKKYMALEINEGTQNATTQALSTENSLFKRLFPLAVVISYLIGTVLVIAWATKDFSVNSLMAHYMGGFFLIFSFFKFLNLDGFVNAFQTYDPFAKAWRPYGYLYATFELFAGVGYLLTPSSITLNALVLIALTISSVGVIKAVRSKQQIQCACLGTIFNLPMTKVTIVENVSMMTMAAVVVLKNLV